MTSTASTTDVYVDPHTGAKRLTKPLYAMSVDDRRPAAEQFVGRTVAVTRKEGSGVTLGRVIAVAGILGGAAGARATFGLVLDLGIVGRPSAPNDRTPLTWVYPLSGVRGIVTIGDADIVVEVGA